jgi:hypothetical protein
MASLHEKMQTDYLWIRSHNPNDINARQRYYHTITLELMVTATFIKMYLIKVKDYK